MPLVSAKQMLLKATRERYAVGAFNVTSIVQMKAVIEAAVNKRAPLIVQTSTSPAKFFGPRLIVAACRALAESAPIPVCLHLDHCTDGGDHSSALADARTRGRSARPRRAR